MKIYRVFDHQEAGGYGPTHTSSMKRAKEIAKHMDEPEIELVEFNNDKATIIRWLNYAAGLYNLE